MESKEKIVSVLFITLGLAAFGFINKSKQTRMVSNCKVAVAVKHDTGFGLPIFELTESVPNPRNEDVYFRVGGKSNRKITKEVLTNADNLNEIISDYPSKWINEYVIVELSTMIKNHKSVAVSSDQVLTREQKNILEKADYFTDVEVKVKYLSENNITKNLDEHQMNISMTIVPVHEAEFVGGYSALLDYLKEKSKGEISRADQLKISIEFEVNQKGRVEGLNLIQGSGSPETDQVMMDILSAQPKWNPAHDAAGSPVKQTFILSSYPGGC